MGKPKYWVKNVISILTQFQLSLPTVGYIFNPAVGFLHILPKFCWNPAFLIQNRRREQKKQQFARTDEDLEIWPETFDIFNIDRIYWINNDKWYRKM